MDTILENYVNQHILIADTEPNVRSALKLFFENFHDCEEVGEAAHTKEVLKYVCRHGPGLLVLDWELPGQALDYFIFVLRMIYPDLLIVALGLSEKHRSEALAAGANAYVNKLDFPEQLMATVDELWGADEELVWESLYSVEV